VIDEPAFVKDRRRQVAREEYAREQHEDSVDGELDRLVRHAKESCASKKRPKGSTHDLGFDPNLVEDYYGEDHVEGNGKDVGLLRLIEADGSLCTPSRSATAVSKVRPHIKVRVFVWFDRTDCVKVRFIFALERTAS
jgi:hypothetical protein